MFELLALLIIIFVNIVFGGLVITRNYKNTANRLYALLSFSVIVWSTVNFLTNRFSDESSQLLTSRLSFAIGLLMLVVVWAFSLYFPRSLQKVGWQWKLLLLLVPCVVFITVFTSHVATGVEYISERELTNVITGQGYFLYLITLLAVFGLSVKNFIRAYQTSETKVRNQLRLIAWGIGGAFVWALFTSVIIPIVTKDWEIAKFATLGSLFIIIPTGYAMLKHRLFDIRLVVARSLGYLLSVGSLVVLYAILAFSVIEVIFTQLDSSETARQLTYTLLAVMLAFTYQPLKRFFDKLTNKLFYRDAYDTQELLDNINTVLVSTINLKELTQKTSQIIQDTLKLEFTKYLLISEKGVAAEFVGAEESEGQRIKIDSRLFDTNRKTLVTDDLGQKDSKKQAWLQDNDVGLLLRLKDQQDDKSDIIGYIAVGNKKSGSPFSSQDIKILEIIADELVIAIQNALRFEEIQKFNVTLQEKVDDATKKLRDANKRLIELDQTKDDFISMASHQLRTPLTSIKGYVSMVMEGDAGKITKKQNDLLNQSFLSAQRMVYLIADLLNVSRLRTGKFVIEQKKTNLAEVIEGEMSQLTETAKGRNLKLSYKKPASFPDLMLDETKIRQVIMNFIDNAVYYTPSGGNISVNLEDKGEAIEFTVVDDGIGVPKNVQHNLFNKFFRADNAKKSRPDGTGLGLFMAKKVVVAQGGSIIFSSQEGKGSTFGFSFTKKPLLPENFKGTPQEKNKTS